MRLNPFCSIHNHSITITQFGKVEVFVFEFPGQDPVTAIVIGKIDNSIPPLVRIHSRCLYGEVFKSTDCDCKNQLELAFQMISEEGAGIFIYLEQEGRGCGLINKARAYELKEKDGLDTVEAYKKLGLAVDPRQYTTSAEILMYFGIKKVRLLTNNPLKISGLEENGIRVEQINLRTLPTPENIDYLKVKQSKLSHDLGLRE